MLWGIHLPDISLFRLNDLYLKLLDRLYGIMTAFELYGYGLPVYKAENRKKFNTAQKQRSINNSMPWGGEVDRTTARIEI